MTDLYLLRENRVVEAVDPALADALAWCAEHEPDDLMTALEAFCAGARSQRAEVADVLERLLSESTRSEPCSGG